MFDLCKVLRVSTTLIWRSDFLTFAFFVYTINNVCYKWVYEEYCPIIIQILKSKVNRHHEIKHELKFHLQLLKAFYEQNFQNIVTRGAKLQSFNVSFTCFPMETWISGVPPRYSISWNTHLSCPWLYGWLVHEWHGHLHTTLW